MKVALTSLDARSLQLLVKRVDELIQERALDLANGGAMHISDTHATGQHYSGEVHYIRALRDVIELCKHVEDDLLGRGKK